MFHGPGPGRPKGMRNKTTQLQRHVAEMVLGKPGTPEFDAFVKAERDALMNGTMHPAVKQLWMHYGLGKPAEHIEIVESTDMTGTSARELQARAMEIISRTDVNDSESDSAVH